MKETMLSKYLILTLCLCIIISAKSNSYGSNMRECVIPEAKASYLNYSDEIKSDQNTKKTGIVKHKRVKRWLNGKPAIVNIIMTNPKTSGAVIKPAYGSYYINNVKSVKDIAAAEAAVAGINASYFKPDTGTPLGTSIVDGKVITGPLFRRVTLGVTRDKQFKMARINIGGKITIGDDVNLGLFNINQPVFSKKSFTIFTDQWGKNTPKTSQYYSHIVVKDNMLSYIKNSSVPIPKGGYVLVGPHSVLPKNVRVNDYVNYSININPKNWNDVEYAVGGGPYLIKNGKIFIDQQRFSNRFLWSKLPRTAVGYTKNGTLVFITVDGRQKGYSEGATMYQLAILMYELGCYNAMNLDGGTSTQMVYNGKLVNYPTVKGGSRVTNALTIVMPALDTSLSTI